MQESRATRIIWRGVGLVLFAAPKYVVQIAQADEGAWKGEVVDLACYLAKGAKGEDHKKCAQMGQPIGLHTTDGKLFVLVGAQEGSGLDDAKKAVGSQVEIKGKMLSRDGLRGIAVASVTEGQKTAPPKPPEGSR